MGILDGWKTYILSLIATGSAIYFIATDKCSAAEGFAFILAAGGFASLRDAIGKVGK